ncbi:Hsp20/alpha crystallin family protein [candidate division WOR-3 bacterium]|nr:Hsp20/alpha crystallin family protein [candidate division WOR-3 bacterium]
MKRSVKNMPQDELSNGLTVLLDQEPDIDRNILQSGFIQWQPYYDMYILNDEVVVSLEIAGIDLKDVLIYAHKSHVTITGTRRRPLQFTPECCRFHTSEIPYGRFFRRIEFPVPVLPDKQRHNVYNGLLTLFFPVIQERVIPIEDE